jgi:hypothetical protein
MKRCNAMVDTDAMISAIMGTIRNGKSAFAI